MLPADVRIGWVFRYAYLWNWQHAEGMEEGDKDRPCLVLAIVLSDDASGSKTVRILPITHSSPTSESDAIEIPAPVKSRLQLDNEPSWIMLTESNVFAWPGPDLRPVETATGYYGPLPPKLFDEVKRRFVAIARGAVKPTTPHRGITRTE